MSSETFKQFVDNSQRTMRKQPFFSKNHNTKFDNKFLPITGKPQGPGGSLEKECSHMAFPVRNRQTKKQRKKIWPSDVNSSIASEKLMLTGNRPRKCSLLVRASTLLFCVQGSNGLSRERLSISMRTNCLHLSEHLSIYRRASRYSVNKELVHVLSECSLCSIEHVT